LSNDGLPFQEILVTDLDLPAGTTARNYIFAKAWGYLSTVVIISGILVLALGLLAYLDTAQ